jgi:hypothetical protein
LSVARRIAFGQARTAIHPIFDGFEIEVASVGIWMGKAAREKTALHVFEFGFG